MGNVLSAQTTSWYGRFVEVGEGVVEGTTVAVGAAVWVGAAVTTAVGVRVTTVTVGMGVGTACVGGVPGVSSSTMKVGTLVGTTEQAASSIKQARYPRVFGKRTSD